LGRRRCGSAVLASRRRRRRRQCRPGCTRGALTFAIQRGRAGTPLRKHQRPCFPTGQRDRRQAHRGCIEPASTARFGSHQRKRMGTKVKLLPIRGFAHHMRDSLGSSTRTVVAHTDDEIPC
jgi:hypothetical protein